MVRADLVAISDSAVWHDNAESLLECADFLNAENIAPLPEGAIVINTARGDVVDDDALVAALESGRLRAAGLDVYRGEPDNIHPGYARLSNTFPLPHIGSATVKTRSGMGLRALDNLDAFLPASRRPTAWPESTAIGFVGAWRYADRP